MSSFRPVSSLLQNNVTYSSPNLRQSNIIHTIQPMQMVQTNMIQAPVVPVRQIIIESPEKRSDEQDGQNAKLEEELDAWRRKYLALETVHQRCTGYEDRIEAMEGRIKILREDNRRLNSALRDKINEYEQQRVNFYQVELENHDLKTAKLQCQRYQELLMQRTQELDDSRKRCSELETQLSALASFELTLKDYEGRIQLQNQEIELWKKRYGQLDTERIKGLDEWKKSSETLRNSQFQDQRKSTELQKTAFLNEVKNLRVQVEKLTMENYDLKKKLQQLEIQSYDWTSKKQELEQKLNHTKVLNDKLNQLVNEKAKENESLKIKVSRKVKGITVE